MKRKLMLIVAMIAILACLFALSVSASVSTSYDKTEKVTVTLTSGAQECALYDEEGNALVWYTLDDGATVVSIKTSDLVFSNETSLADISLSDGTLLQKHNESTTNKIVVANLRDKTFTKVTHSSYKATFSDSKVVQYVYLPNTITSFGCNIFQNCTNLKVCDIPSDAVFSIDDANCFVGCSSLVEMNLTGCTRIGTSNGATHSCFSGCTSLQRVIIDPENFTGTILGGSLFASAPLTQFGLVQNECHIPDTVETIGVNVFKGSRFTKVYFGDAVKTTGYNVFDGNTNLKDVYFNANYETMDQRAFMDCTALTNLHGLENTKLLTIPNESFRNTKIKEIILPNTLESLGQTAFASYTTNNTVTTKVVLGANFKTFISYDGFKNFAALKEVYLPVGCTSIPGNVFNLAANDCVFYFTGTLEQLNTLVANTNSSNSAFTDASKQIKSVKEFNALQTKSGRYIVYDYSVCDAFYNAIHVESDTVNGSACYLADCERCNVEKKYVGGDVNSGTHTLTSEYVYANGYMQAGQIISICSNPGCTHGTEATAFTEKLEAIFTGLKYSTSTEGTGICVVYDINQVAVAKYQESGKTLKYGVAAAFSTNTNEGEVVKTDATAVDGLNGVIVANVTDTSLKSVTFRIHGDKKLWEDNNTKSLYMVGFATNGDAVEYLGEASGATDEEGDLIGRNNIESVKAILISDYFPTPAA